MISFLFWNMMNRDLRRLVAQAAADHDVDILLLAESGVSDADLAAELRVVTGKAWTAFSLDGEKVRIFTRLAKSKWRKRQADDVNGRMTIWSIKVGKPPGILLAAAHFVSKNNASPGEQALLAAELATEVRRVEDTAGHERTVIVGDLNMNPFEEGVTGAPALHAVMTRQVAGRGNRMVQGRSYRFFYNPMWGCWGDRTEGPPGTYFHPSPTPADLFWHMFDQVLLRPALMDTLRELTILDHIGGERLVTDPAGVPRTAEYSDHLPLSFRLDLD